jgi:hypothetical protein
MIECRYPASCLIMPSIEHESAVQILHANPQLVAMLLGSCGVRLPSGAVPLAADSNLSDRDPTDLRSDNVLIFEGIGGKIAVIAEVQKDKRDVGRMRSWRDPPRCSHVRTACHCRSTRRATRELHSNYPSGSLRICTGSPGGTNDDPLERCICRRPPRSGPRRGRAEGEAHLLLRIMTARGLDIPEHVRVRVAECTDTAILEAWADRAATATSVADVFEV